MADNKVPHLRNLILSSTPVATVTMDAAFTITSFNNLAEHLTGFRPPGLLEAPVIRILHNSKCDAECPLQTVQDTVLGWLQFGPLYRNMGEE